MHSGGEATPTVGKRGAPGTGGRTSNAVDADAQVHSSRLSGSRDSFESFYQDTFDSVAKYVARRIDDSGEIEDVVASTYLVAWKRRTHMASMHNPTAWLIGVARNILQNKRRSTFRRLRTVAKMQTVHVVAFAPSLEDWPTFELEDEVRTALGTLSTTDREVLELRAFDQLSIDEIAVICGLTPAAVRSRLHRSRRVVRNELLSAGQLQGIEVED